MRRAPRRVGFGAFSLARRLNTHRGRSCGLTERLEHSPVIHGDTLTALHRASAILPNILPSAKVAIWEKVIRTSGDILSGATIRRPRIAVLGLDQLSQSHELISALLDDPLASEQKDIHALRSRRRNSPDELMVISPDCDLQQSDSQLNLNLPWLKTMNVDILEIPSGHPDAIPLLYDADIQVIIASPISTPLVADLLSFISNPGTLLILQYPTHDQRVVDYTVSQLTRLRPATLDILKSKILRVSPLGALTALDLFRNESSSAEVGKIFQNEFLSSGVTTVSRSISSLLSLNVEDRRARLARLALKGALEACQITIQHTSRDIDAVQKFIQELRFQICNASDASIRDVLGGDDALTVANSVQRSTREMQSVMDAISWWRLPGKVDDLSGALYHAAERVWCRDLYAKLEFETGRLASSRSMLTSKTFDGIRLLPPTFQSALLFNQLHQLSARPPELAPNSLIYPLSYRLRQLQQPILRLHRQAQRAILTASLTTLGSLGGAYAAWSVGWVAPPTAVGLGALGFIVGLRWFIGKWESSKSRWWEDWRRVGSGLERDVEEMLTLIVNEKVTDVPNKAAEELEKAVALRRVEIVEVGKELESIASRLRCPHSNQQNPVQ